jgi:dCMP deaminase
VYLSDKYHDEDAFVASRRMFDMAGVVFRQLEPKRKTIVIDLSGDVAAKPRA